MRQAPPAQAASNDLAAYWNFDESTAGSTAADSSGNGNDLTPTNSPVPSTDIPAAMNQGIADSHSASFDGLSQYFSVADNSSFDNASAVSISTWVKFNSVSGNQTIVAKWNTGVNDQWVLQAMGNKITWWTGNGSNGGSDELISSADITTGTWYHLVATATNGTKNLYINGSLDNTNTAGIMGVASGTPVSVGSKLDGGGSYFEYLNGNVDDTRVYSRVLDATEASSLASGNESTTLTGGSAVTNEIGTTSTITDLQVDAGTASNSTTEYVKLYVSHGTISLGTTTGLTFYDASGSSLGSSQPANSAILHIGGSISDVNTALATLQYIRTDAGTGTDDLQASLVQPGQVFFSDNGHLYRYVAGPVTWTQAKTAADASTLYGAQGYLATITSQAENDFIQTQLQSDSWIGASDDSSQGTSEGNWIWADGPEAGEQFWQGDGSGSVVNGMYAHWNNPTTDASAPGVEPNNVGGNENCAEFFYSVGGASNGLWNDEPCTYSASNLGYIIEYGAPGALPTVASKDVSITTNDTTAPTAPGKPTVLPASPTTDTTPSLSWAASTDSGTGLASPAYTVEWSQDSTFATITGSATTNSTTYTFATALADATWYFRIVAEDTSGNAATSDVSNALIIDTTAPTAPGQPLAAQHVTNDTTPDISWTAAQDKGSGLADPAYKLEWSMDQTFATGISSLTTNSTSVTIPASLSTGKWWLRLTATDNDGNTVVTGNSVIIDTLAPDTPAASPAGGTYASTQTVLLSSSDNLTNPLIYYTTDGSTPTSLSTQFHDASTPIIISRSETLKAVAYDSVGNISLIMTEKYIITTTTTTPGTPHKPAPTKTNTNSATTNTSPSTAQTPLTESATSKAPSPPQTTPSQTNENDQKNPDTKSTSAFLGLGWWWLLVATITTVLFWWLIATKRRKHSIQQ